VNGALMLLLLNFFGEDPCHAVNDARPPLAGRGRV
jgi:hypothetical protein